MCSNASKNSSKHSCFIQRCNSTSKTTLCLLNYLGVRFNTITWAYWISSWHEVQELVRTEEALSLGGSGFTLTPQRTQTRRLCGDLSLFFLFFFFLVRAQSNVPEITLTQNVCGSLISVIRCSWKHLWSAAVSFPLCVVIHHKNQLDFSSKVMLPIVFMLQESLTSRRPLKL